MNQQRVPFGRLRQLLSIGATTILSSTLAACGSANLSPLSDDGRIANAQPVFPSIQFDAWLPRGTFPNLDNLRTVRPGMDKDQLYGLLGHPHFQEGVMTKVREWDYVFHLPTGNGNETRICQYKVTFDNSLQAREFYWKPAACSAALQPKAVESPPAPAPVDTAATPAAPRVSAAATATVREVKLLVEALLAFDRGAFQDILPDSRKQLEVLVAQLHRMGHIKLIQILGYADRLGSPDHNTQLSWQRAESIRDYLVGQGLPEGAISARGVGSADPVVDCGDAAPASLVACLQPNRRVQIRINALE